MDNKNIKMKQLALNENVLKYLVDENSLISSTLNSILIKNENGLIIDFNFNLLYSPRNLILRFKKVQEYSLNFSTENSFYYVEDLKFFYENNMYYISLDPDLTFNGSSTTDNDIVISIEVELYELT